MWGKYFTTKDFPMQQFVDRTTTVLFEYIFIRNPYLYSCLFLLREELSPPDVKKKSPLLSPVLPALSLNREVLPTPPTPPAAGRLTSAVLPNRGFGAAAEPGGGKI